MPRDDYEAISKIIEQVVGNDTLTGVKLLEGIKFYFDNKKTEIKIIKEDNTIRYKMGISVYKKDADKAMSNYTEKLNKENVKLRKKRDKCCAVSGG
jgi:hypothetical protein